MLMKFERNCFIKNISKLSIIVFVNHFNSTIIIKSLRSFITVFVFISTGNGVLY